MIKAAMAATVRSEYRGVWNVGRGMMDAGGLTEEFSGAEDKASSLHPPGIPSLPTPLTPSRLLDLHPTAHDTCPPRSVRAHHASGTHLPSSFCLS